MAKGSNWSMTSEHWCVNAGNSRPLHLEVYDKRLGADKSGRNKPRPERSVGGGWPLDLFMGPTYRVKSRETLGGRREGEGGGGIHVACQV